jgi:carboxylesterase type B
MILQSLLLAGAAATSYAQQELLVKTTAGSVQGHYAPLDVREWNGIPYATPPVGDLRWEQSTPAAPWESTYTANFMAPGCPQVCNLPPGNCPEYGTSEDCLYLSVWAPNKPSEDPAGYPVMFWVHGGAYEQGLGDCALYNGTQYAQLDVVTVAINYRLGTLGYMAAENQEGNYGILDQRLALQWTQDNIAGFGGNPKRVTLGGQSAGGMSVAAHLISEGSQDLFAQGAMESNPLALPFHTRESAKANADAAFTYLNCTVNDIACMRSKSVDEILDAQKHAPSLDLDNLFINFLPWSPMVEKGGLIPEQPLTAMSEGRMAAKPMISGTVKDEGQLFVYELFPTALSETAYKLLVRGIFGKDAAKEILKLYPLSCGGTDDGRDAFNVLGTDLLFYCPLRLATRGYQSVLGAESTPTYIYRFDHATSFDCWGPGYEFCFQEGMVCHGSELPFEFNVFTDGSTVSYTPSEEEIQLTKDVADLWANFIHNSNPNNGEYATPANWPLYQAKLDELLVLNEPGVTVASHQREKYCDTWDRLGYFY